MSSVLVVDDHPIVSQAVQRILRSTGVKTVFDAHDVVSGYRMYRRNQPEVVVIDLSMQGKGLAGMHLIRRIRAHSALTRIIVFSMYSDPNIVARALEAGANAYVLKDSSSTELVKAFEKVCSGASYLSGDLATHVALMRNSSQRNPLAGLTPRELETLTLVAEGKPYSQIAEELNVSYKTVVNVCYQLRQKLEARNLQDLVRVAIKLLPSAS
jgi:two-component system, NarL family, invasion response regulator UvrY